MRKDDTFRESESMPVDDQKMGAFIPSPVPKLARDLKIAAATLTPHQARFLVDEYYQMQEQRIRGAHQERALQKSGEPHEVLVWFGDQARTLENQMRAALGEFAKAHAIGRWMMDIYGIGPVISAGLLAHIDIAKCPHAGHLYSFAGLDPKAVWAKGEKRPWNAALKTLVAFKLGECFVKVCNKEGAVYGQVYAQAKKKLIARNEAGDFAEESRRILSEKNFGKTTDAYKHYSAGRLPPAHVHARARRVAVKLFLSHLHEVWRRHEGLPVGQPYAIGILGHEGYIPPSSHLP